MIEFNNKKHWSGIKDKYVSLQKINNQLKDIHGRVYYMSNRMSNAVRSDDIQGMLIKQIKQLYDISYNEGA